MNQDFEVRKARLESITGPGKPLNDQHVERVTDPPPTCLRTIGQCKFDCQVVLGRPIMLDGGPNLKGLAYEGFDGKAVP